MLQMTVSDMSILFLCKPFSDADSFICCLAEVFRKGNRKSRKWLTSFSRFGKKKEFLSMNLFTIALF